MYTVLVTSSHDLITTKRQQIIQYSNLADIFQLLIPTEYEGKDVTDAEILLEYFLPVSRDYRTEKLRKSEELYKGHLEYKLPFDTRLTTEPGNIEVWATIKLMETEPDGDLYQWVRKTASTMIKIELAPGQHVPTTDDFLKQEIERLENKIIDILKQQADFKQTDETAYDYIKNKPDENDALVLVAEMELVTPVAAEDGSFFVDENGALYTL